MKFHAKAALTLTVLGVVAIGVWRFVEPMVVRALQSDVSDVGEKGTIQIGIDGWVGYFPLCSPEMKRRMNREGYGLRCVDDAADYKDRFRKLKSGEYQFAVATVDSYLLNGDRYAYPGPIIAVLDESKGGDAIVARKSSVENIEALKALTQVRVAFTPDSPSHHLLKAVAKHFDIAALKSASAYVKANGSEDAMKLIESGKADVAVLWEPEVSKILEDEDYVRLLGTEETRQLIVDILIASRSAVKNDPDMINTLLRNYFSVLKHYRDEPEELVDDIRDHYDIKRSIAESLLGGVEWATLHQNAEYWYAVGSRRFAEEALIESIESAADILVDSRDFDRTPVPDEDPYLLVNSGFVKALYEDYGAQEGDDVDASKQLVFAPLSAQQWARLQQVAALKARHINFASGTSELTLEGKQKIDELMSDLRHYPAFRVEIRGHTGLRGDKQQNLELSQERADAVLRYMDVTHTIEANRARAVGFGAAAPLKQQPGESDRAYNYRLPRVEIVLVRESL